jgi:acyl-CoA hydrolase
LLKNKYMNLTERISSTETHQFRMIFSEALNDNEVLFGGLAMKWMDEVAYITALRYTRMKVVTVSVDNLKFLQAIKPGSMIEIIGRVVKAGTIKIEIQVNIFVETSNSDLREKAVEASFTFAAINDDYKPICIDKNKRSKRDEFNTAAQIIALPKFDRSFI